MLIQTFQQKTSLFLIPVVFAGEKILGLRIGSSQTANVDPTVCSIRGSFCPVAGAPRP